MLTRRKAAVVRAVAVGRPVGHGRLLASSRTRSFSECIF